MRFWVIVLTLVIATLFMPSSAAAQSVNCTTYFADTSMPMTNCNSPAGSYNCTTYFADTSMPQTRCSGPGLEQRPTYIVAPQPSYSAPPAVVYTPPIDTGVTINLDSGGQRYLPAGTFVKVGDALTIYWVYGAQLHAFGAWQQFLSAGGSSDLSNVVRFAWLRDNGGLIGSPVPLR